MTIEFWSVIAFFGVIALFYTITVYNSIITLKNQIKKSWSNIDVLLKQRNDELPNLQRVVKGYMKHEENVLQEITRIRTQIHESRSVKEKSALSSALTGFIRSIFINAESYPSLRASENFLELQKRITEIENEIADRREFYNDAVNLYNVRIQSFPSNIFAKLLKFESHEVFG